MSFFGHSLRALRTILLFSAGLLFPAATIAETSTEVLLGSATLNTRIRPDFDVIELGGCPNVSSGVTAVQIEVRRRGADIDSLGVVYGSGVRDELPVRERFVRGSRSRWIDLRGAERCIQRIWIVGDSEGLPGARAQVFVHGRK